MRPKITVANIQKTNTNTENANAAGTNCQPTNTERNREPYPLQSTHKNVIAANSNSESAMRSCRNALYDMATTKLHLCYEIAK